MGLSIRVFASQTRVGGRLIDFNNEAYVLLQEAVFNPGYGAGAQYTAANKLAHNLIHEMIHVAASTGTYSFDDDEKLVGAVNALGASSVNTLIQQHCNVSKGK